MAFLDSRNRPSAASMAGVVAIHGAVGAALILGLTISGTIIAKDPPPSTFDLPKTPPPPEPQPVEPQTEAPVQRDIQVPQPPIEFNLDTSRVKTTEDIRPLQPTIPIPNTGDIKIEIPAPTPTPTPTSSFAPTLAKPRNDPGRWVSTEDYRGNWIRRELTGRVGFRLEIAADGRVANCSITSSSGHAELDEATCALVSRRAKFQPARNGSGDAVGGSYSNAVEWRLPQ